MLASSQKLVALTALLPLLAAAAPLVNGPKPFYLKPHRDSNQLIVVAVGAGEAVYSGAPVTIQAVDDEKDGRVVYDQWEFVESKRTQLRLAGSTLCLDATTANPSSFTEVKVWPCNEALPAQVWDYSPTVRWADGTEYAKLSIDSGKQCLDWKDGSTEIAQTFECVSGNRNQIWIKTEDKHFSSVASIMGGTSTEVSEGATLTTAAGAVATTTAGQNGVSSVFGNVQGGSNVNGGGTGLPATSNIAQVVSSRLAPQATDDAGSDATTTAQQPGTTSLSASSPRTTVIVNDGGISTTSVAFPIASSSFAGPAAVQTVVLGGTLVKRADSVASSVIGQIVNGNPATSSLGDGVVSTVIAPVPTATSRAEAGLGATTSLAPVGTSTSVLPVVSSSVASGPATVSASLVAPTPTTLFLVIAPSGTANGSSPSDAGELQKWTCYRETTNEASSLDRCGRTH